MDNLSIGRLLRGTRKHLGLSQSCVAKHLGIDQSALSRVESGQQVLSALEWYQFCNFAGISLNCLKYGAIEGLGSKIRIPKRYLRDQKMKTRGILPLFQYFQKIFGENKLVIFLKERNLDPDLILNLDASISSVLATELIEELNLTSTDYFHLTQSVARPQTHGTLHFIYDSVCETYFDLFSAWVLSSNKYSENAKFKIRSLDKDFFEIVMKIEPDSLFPPHLLNLYFLNYFKNFSTYQDRNPLVVTLISQPNPSEAVFRFSY